MSNAIRGFVPPHPMRIWGFPRPSPTSVSSGHILGLPLGDPPFTVPVCSDWGFGWQHGLLKGYELRNFAVVERVGISIQKQFWTTNCSNINGVHLLPNYSKFKFLKKLTLLLFSLFGIEDIVNYTEYYLLCFWICDSWRSQTSWVLLLRRLELQVYM